MIGGDAMATRWRRDDDARLVSFKRGLTIDKLPSFSRFLSLAQLSYGVQTRFLGKSMGKLYWKEGERNKHDTVQSNWAGTVMLGTGAMQIAHALDGEATKNQLAGAAIFWGLSIPEFINQRDDFNTPMLIANASMCTAMGAVLLKAWMDKKD
tara:strand:+ start:377 stop:832 length:456 start_codon:yes stop_codon:yes gene_type:complete